MELQNSVLIICKSERRGNTEVASSADRCADISREFSLTDAKLDLKVGVQQALKSVDITEAIEVKLRKY